MAGSFWRGALVGFLASTISRPFFCGCCSPFFGGFCSPFSCGSIWGCNPFYSHSYLSCWYA